MGQSFLNEQQNSSTPLDGIDHLLKGNIQFQSVRARGIPIRRGPTPASSSETAPVILSRRRGWEIVDCEPREFVLTATQSCRTGKIIAFPIVASPPYRTQRKNPN